MKTIKVTIQGKTPLLMNNPAQMSIEKKTKKVGEKYLPAEEAEKSAYRGKDGVLYIPSRCIYATLINAAKQYRVGKQSASAVFAGTVRVEPFEVSLNTKTYEIDAQRVVIQRMGIIKCRASLPEWKASFDLVYDDKWINNPELLREVLDSAGSRVGLLDYRPQRKGPYGTFEITGWKEVN